MRDYGKAIAAMAKMVNIPGGAHLEIRAAAYAQLGRQEEAHATMTEYLRLRPGRTIRTASRFPFKNANDLEHWLEGLRKAGLPE
jgi:regulator of sirC expression with transglutaminase-like and TPR domain